MENNDFEITDKELMDSMKESIIFLEEALKQDDKELRKRISGLVEQFKELDLEKLFK